ncbi:MAG: IPT/TIG domain-containing protein [Candidatus Kapabacteria bacterium]|jgi:hypothetical protein|nr:IPT/TIG domain-containing protein [Candidatus Kapabacteria bacterium]
MAVVPANAVSGEISVVTPAGTFLSRGLTILRPGTITSFAPTSARRGATISITGTGFTGATAVQLGGVNVASFIVISNTKIDAVVGNGGTGSVSVTTPAGVINSGQAVFTFVP